jgi:uncharacterized protein
MAKNRFAFRARPFRRVLILISALLLAGFAPVPAAAKNSRGALAFGQGLLWKIEGQGPAPSYLFGTIHLSDPRVTTLPEPVEQAFTGAASYTMEAPVLSSEAMLLAAEQMFFSDGHTLAGVIGPELYGRARDTVARHMGREQDISHQKPWAVAMQLGVPPPSPGGLPLDISLQLRATMLQKPVHWLETMAEQLAVFNELALTEQTELLAETLRVYPEMQSGFEDMVRAYLARDVAAIFAVEDRFRSNNRALEEKIERRLLTDRNRRMVERMRPRLEQGRAFIAVGAAHLPGDTGLLRLLERAGYRVSRVY